jgi:predicted  nucleic acid-binding Zn-ribbon protein
MEFLNSLQEHIKGLEAQIEMAESTIQKLNSRLDESNLNFKYETLIKTYNEAEIENTALKRQNALLTAENASVKQQYEKLTVETNLLRKHLQNTETALVDFQLRSSSGSGSGSVAENTRSRQRGAPSEIYILQTL